jgi:serine/threonine-protein kinase
MTHLPEKVRRAVGERYRLEPEPAGFPSAVPPWQLFFATDVVLARRVVIKAIAMEELGPETGLRFEKEVGSAESAPGWLGRPDFPHPRLLPILARSGRGEVLYSVTPWMPEGSLRVRLRREPCVPVADAVRILDDVAEALEFLHARGYVHWRVKPENVLFDQGRAVLADNVSRIAPGTLIEGSLHQSPEQMRGERGDARSDLHALGMVGFEMLAGRPPFQGTPVQQVYDKVQGVVPDLVSLRPEVPRALAAVVSKAMSVRPDDRHADATEFRAALRDAAAGWDAP